MKLQKVCLVIAIAIGCMFSFSVFAETQYPTGTAFVIRYATSIEVQSDNPDLYQVNRNAVIFNKPGVANLKIIAHYGNNKSMLFNETVHVVPNKGIEDGLQLTFNSDKNGFETINTAKKYRENGEYLPVDFNGTRNTNVVKNSENARNLVAAGQLDNKTLLHWNLTDEQYQMCYDAAVRFAQPLVHIESRKQILKQLAIDLRKYFDQEVSYSTEAPHFLDAYGFFVNKAASCQGETCATGFCLNILGIEYEHVNHNKWKHQWCRVKVEDGTYWICDSYGLYCGPEPAPYLHPRFN
ncbi:MAG: hypothetical protein IKZ43_01180 [Acidaminococcaceae bacterium]|nr:hypothetical protein [Acidaminococcaceae bacterium]